ncbi:MAG: hypothetical protein ACXVXP_09715 [Mycobacteriaceae bacterium]
MGAIVMGVVVEGVAVAVSVVVVAVSVDVTTWSAGRTSCTTGFDGAE